MIKIHSYLFIFLAFERYVFRIFFGKSINFVTRGREFSNLSIVHLCFLCISLSSVHGLIVPQLSQCSCFYFYFIFSYFILWSFHLFSFCLLSFSLLCFIFRFRYSLVLSSISLFSVKTNNRLFSLLSVKFLRRDSPPSSQTTNRSTHKTP